MKSVSFCYSYFFCVVVVLSLSLFSTKSLLQVHAAYETWTETFESVHAAFKDNLIMRERLLRLMDPVLSFGATILYADAFCANREFIHCFLPSGDEFKGGSSSYAWRLHLTVEDVEKKGFESEIHWSKLPRVIQSLTIKRCHFDSTDHDRKNGSQKQTAINNNNTNNNTNNRLDISKVISRLPHTIREVRIEFCDGVFMDVETINNVGALEKLEQESKISERYNVKERSFLHSLALNHCIIDDKTVFSKKVGLPWFQLLGIQKFTMESCSFRNPQKAANKIPLLISNMNQLQELNIVTNKFGGNFLLKNFGKMIQAVSDSGAFAKLLSLNVDFDEDDVANNNKNNNVAHQQGDGKNQLDFETTFDEERTSVQLAHLVAAERFRFSNVPFTRVPALPSSLKSLSILFGALTGDFPSDLASFYNLQEVDFTGNDITQIDLVKAIPSSLTRINLAGNLLSGSALLSDLSKLPRHLIEFNVSGNDLSGKNTMDFKDLPPNIEIFDISYNSLTGPVDISGRLPDSMKYFCINNNKFTGRYDIAKLPLLSVKIALGNNNWDSLMPSR